MAHIYEKGTIKVVWIEGGEKIFSKMFDNAANAKEFAEDKNDFLIFKLLKEVDMKEFTWKLLPYGKYDIYKKLLSFYKKGILKKILKGTS